MLTSAQQAALYYARKRRRLRRAAEEVPAIPGPTDISLSATSFDEDALADSTIATISATSDTDGATYTFALTDDADGMFAISGANLNLAAAVPSGETLYLRDVTIRATLVETGGTYSETFTLSITPTDATNDSGLEDTDGTLVPVGEFTIAPTVGGNGGALKFKGKTGGLAYFVFDIGPASAGGLYTYSYVPHFEQLSNGGKNAFVGFGFKTGDSFHLAGLKGDGATGLTKHTLSGTSTASVTSTGSGAPTNGTQAGPNFIQIEISADGTTYTLRTSGDSGATWDDEFTAATPTPFADTGTTQFGLAVFLENTDKGIFSIDVTEWTFTASLAPGTFDLSEYEFVNLAAGTEIVAKGAPSAFDERMREIGNTIYDPDDTGEEYKLVYTGYSGVTATTNTRIGYAYSSDGITWTKGGQLTLGADRAGEDPYLVKSGSTYYLYVEDKTDNPFRNIRLFTSTDFATWTDQGDVLDIGTGWEAQDVSSPVVWIEGTTWYMLYEGRANNQGGAVGLATSSDGIAWTKSGSNPVLVGQNATYSYTGPISWSDGIAPDDIVKVGSTYSLLIHGRKDATEAFYYRGGIVTSTDLVTWTDALAGNQIYALPAPDATIMMLPTASTLFHYYTAPGGGIQAAGEGGGDANWTSVVLFVTGYGYDAETRAYDLSASWHPLTAAGNAQIDDAQSKFGPSSMLFDGTGDYYSIPTSTDWDFGSGDFTVEAWIRRAASGQMMIVTRTDGSDAGESWYLDYTGTNLRFVARPDTTNFIVVSGAVTLTTGTWYHVAADRSGSTWRVYVDGAVVGTLSDARTIQTVTSNVRIGARQHPTPLAFNGHIEGVRITKGVARYAGAFTAPTAIYPIGPVPV